jgi:hypothetical protein
MDETGIERHLGLAQPTGTHLEGGRQQGADAECHFMIEARLQRIDPWTIIDNFHRHITVSGGELSGERAPSRLVAPAHDRRPALSCADQVIMSRSVGLRFLVEPAARRCGNRSC